MRQRDYKQSEAKYEEGLIVKIGGRKGVISGVYKNAWDEWTYMIDFDDGDTLPHPERDVAPVNEGTRPKLYKGNV